ncbi:MAG: Mur ligase family protein, partial [Clostridia bacterium]
MFYKEAVDYIKNIERLGSDYGIERMRELLVLLGEPDKNLKFVHVAGTNGKGSVCAYLTQILMQAGHKVGTYNSPSVFCYNERFCINGKPISDDMVAKYMSIIRQAIENEQKMRDAFKLDKFAPTAFEIETALMFSCFFEEECDICVIETGLGGRWDATNVIEDKELAVITSIGLDHCAILGDTLSKIAAEKAAITKKTVVTCAQNDEIMQEISHPYNIENGEKKFYKVDVVVAKEATPISADLSGQKFLYDKKEYKIKLLGDHQLINASIAIAAAEQLNARWNITAENIRQGLQNTAWSARFEIVNDAKERFNISVPHDKVLVLDGGHNPQGAL